MRLYIQICLYLFVLIEFRVATAGSYDDFFVAIKRDDPVVVANLLRRGFDPNTPNPDGHMGLLLAIKEPSRKVVEVLLNWPSTRVEVRNAADESPLMLAALNGYAVTCQKLIQRDADVNKPGWTPLHYAATGGHSAIVQMLLDNYAYIDAASPNGTTPLMMGVIYGTPEVVKMLLEAGADPTIQNEAHLTALDLAQRTEKKDAAAIIAAFLKERNSK
jgi:ankyrin repeat protein